MLQYRAVLAESSLNHDLMVQPGQRIEKYVFFAMVQVASGDRLKVFEEQRIRSCSASRPS
jgi:hypothetical protein